MNKQIATTIQQALDGQLSKQEIEQLVEKPKYEHLGDLAFPCFTLAKKLKKSPNVIAQQISKNIHCEFIQHIEVVGGYVNIFYNRQHVTKMVLSHIVQIGPSYGQKEKNGEKVVIDFSSPNIAKPFSMGHLRSTVIGNALANIAEKNGYEAVRINHLGDWGTQFGKLIVAYKLWGDKEAIAQAPIEQLLKLYVQFHEEAEHNEELNNQARAAFKALEDNDLEATALWQWFKEASLVEFQTVYDLLNIHFDSFNGEAFYNDKMQAVVDELNAKNLLIESEGAHVVQVPNLPPCLITKQDGATLYATRDLAAAFYREQQYKPAKVLYVVGNEQSLHFKQLFSVIKLMGYDWARNLQHVPFGMMLKDGKKMSTRKGRVILLKEVLQEAIDFAAKTIQEKNPQLVNSEAVAKQVGVGAVLFHDLKNFRLNDVEFSIEQMLSFEGETGPYLQYTYARIHTLLSKASESVGAAESIKPLGDTAWSGVVLLEEYPTIVEKAYEEADPSLIAKYALQLARSFNKYYGNTKILAIDDQLSSRLLYCSCVAEVLADALRLLGIAAPKEM
jgi:arginyl-tRNA synthetase